MDSSTRISDLPEMSTNLNAGTSFPPSSFEQMSGVQKNDLMSQPPSYMPMNVHPNPYGNQPPTSVMPPPQQTQLPPKLNSQSFVFPQDQQTTSIMPNHIPTMQAQQPQYQLPSRDIPQDMSIYSIDEKIKSNYIPPAPLNKRDYIYENEEEEEEKKIQKKRKEKKVRFIDDAFVEIQKPFIITLLFLLFQLPFMNAFLFKYLFFLKLFGEDGLMNMWGHVFKSALFGGLVYGLDYLMALLSI